MTNLVYSLKQAIRNVKKPYKKIIFACIGTDRSTGDSYGPIVGTMLKKHGYEVYGTLKNPMHAKNLEFILRNIDTENNLIIAIDASLGYEEDVGKIFIRHKPINPGTSLGKELPKVGDISIQGTVNVGGGMNFMIIQNTRLSNVVDLAEKTVDIIYKAISSISSVKEMRVENE